MGGMLSAGENERIFTGLTLPCPACYFLLLQYSGGCRRTYSQCCVSQYSAVLCGVLPHVFTNLLASQLSELQEGCSVEDLYEWGEEEVEGEEGEGGSWDLEDDGWGGAPPAGPAAATGSAATGARRGRNAGQGGRGQAK